MNREEDTFNFLKRKPILEVLDKWTYQPNHQPLFVEFLNQAGYSLEEYLDAMEKLRARYE